MVMDIAALLVLLVLITGGFGFFVYTLFSRSNAQPEAIEPIVRDKDYVRDIYLGKEIKLDDRKYKKILFTPQQGLLRAYLSGSVQLAGTEEALAKYLTDALSSYLKITKILVRLSTDVSDGNTYLVSGLCNLTKGGTEVKLFFGTVTEYKE